MIKEEDKKILSVEELLHLQSDKHEKDSKVMPEVDTSKYILSQRQKNETVRKFAPIVNITDEQRKQFSQGGTAPSRNAALAEKFRQAMEVAELHAKEEAVEHSKTAAEKTENEGKAAKELTKEIKTGSFDFSFGALIEGSENLKDTI